MKRFTVFSLLKNEISAERLSDTSNATFETDNPTNSSTSTEQIQTLDMRR